jgi:hypothetical protein
MANAPLSERDGESLELIWVSGEAEYFFKRGWAPESKNARRANHWSDYTLPCGPQFEGAVAEARSGLPHRIERCPLCEPKADINLRRQDARF